MRLFKLFLLFILTVTTAVNALALTVKDVRIGQNKERTRLVIETDSKIDPTIFYLENPYRLVIDLPNLKMKTQAESVELPYNSLVRKLRSGQYNPQTYRLVVDLKSRAKLKKFALPAKGKNNDRYVLDLYSANAWIGVGSQKQVVKKQAVQRLAEPKGRTVSKNHLPDILKSLQSNAPVNVDKPRKKSKYFTVMIDPGHGGVDPGAIGRRYKTREKDINLKVARLLQKEINVLPGFRAKLTRSTDVFVKLRDRIKRAQNADADLFISLHADSHENRHLRGASVYVLSEKASDREAASLARHVNRGDMVAGLALKEEASDVRDILIDLTQRETLNSSALLAKEVLASVKRNKVNTRAKHTKFAGFVVLKAPDIPSILVELSYLSNEHDERMLRSTEGQRKLAAAVAEGIKDYVKKHHKMDK